MSASSFNPFSALADFLGGASHSRLSSNLASIHHHVSQELEPDYFTEWTMSQSQRYRSDTTASNSSSLFSNTARPGNSKRMWSALEDEVREPAEPVAHPSIMSAISSNAKWSSAESGQVQS